jgi:hypothetical protein
MPSLRSTWSCSPTSLGFASIGSAKANVNRLLRKLSDKKEISGAASPNKTTEDNDDVGATPPGKKKAGRRKCKTGKFAEYFLFSMDARSRTDKSRRFCC